MSIPEATSSTNSAAAEHKDFSPEPVKPGQPKEIGGRTGPDPTRFGDWEKNGRCIDF